MERVERVIAHLAADDPAPPLLGQNKTAAKKKFNPSDLKLRFLEKGDYDKKFCQLLGQLTDVGTITKDMFEVRFAEAYNGGRQSRPLVI